MEAVDDGYDEALLLDVDGFVAEGAGENLFVIKDGQIFEPEIASALIGITRSTIHQLAKDFGYSIISKRLTRDDVYTADEAFFTGTAAEVTPIRELDRRQIGEGRRGPITTKIQARFFDVVNGNGRGVIVPLIRVSCCRTAGAIALPGPRARAATARDPAIRRLPCRRRQSPRTGDPEERVSLAQAAATPPRRHNCRSPR
jgi:hypothetical protein